VESIQQNFIAYDGKPLIEPQKFFPDADFLKMHNEGFQA
jgi:putative restriction endonuclease